LIDSIALVVQMMVRISRSNCKKGTNFVPAPWDSVVVAVIALAAWLAGVRAGQQHLATSPAADAEVDSERERSQR